MIKNLSQLKKVLAGKPRIEITGHCLPEYVGQVRQVTLALCSVCGYKYPRAKRLTVRNWTCPVCGAPHDRDANAATNILHEGLRLVNQASAA